MILDKYLNWLYEQGISTTSSAAGMSQGFAIDSFPEPKKKNILRVGYPDEPVEEEIEEFVNEILTQINNYDY